MNHRFSILQFGWLNLYCYFTDAPPAQIIVTLPLDSRVASDSELDQVKSGQLAVSLNINDMLIIADYD
jgi:hypothetical protein